MKKSLLALTSLVALSSFSGIAQDATSILQRNPGYQPIARSTRAADADRAAQADQAQQANQANRATQADNATRADTTTYATSAGTANTANTALQATQLDPNAPIDASKLTGLPSCSANQVIGVVGGALSCMTPPASATTKAQFDTYSTFTTPGSFSWIVPAGITRIRVHAVGGGSGGSVSNGGAENGAQGGYAFKAYTVTAGDVISGVVAAGGAGHIGYCSRGPDGGTSTVNFKGIYSFKATGGNGSFACWYSPPQYEGLGVDGDFNSTSGNGTAFKPLSAPVSSGNYGALGTQDGCCNAWAGRSGIVWIEY